MLNFRSLSPACMSDVSNVMSRSNQLPWIASRLIVALYGSRPVSPAGLSLTVTDTVVLEEPQNASRRMALPGGGASGRLKWTVHFVAVPGDLPMSSVARG